MEALVTGSVIADRYELIDELGRGSSAAVYSAKVLADDSVVALKVMGASYARGDEARKRFLREARVTSDLDHPAAVNVLDYGADDGVLYLAMTLLEGESLRVRLGRGVATQADILCVARQVASVLAAAHDIDLIHRDIKPENIFALATPRDGESLSLMVVDFGLAFLAEHDGSLGRLTQDGVLGGTPAYMSPEQAQGEPLTAATDIYSLGCVLYEMASGDVPFVGSIPETLARHAFVAAVPLASKKLPRPLDAALTDLVGDMLKKPTSARPKASEVADRLRDL